MAGYIGSKSSVVGVDSYLRTEADATFLTPTGDGSALTGIVIPPIHDPVAVTGATPSLDVGTYNFFKQEGLTANTTVSFASVPTNARWSYSFEPTIISGGWDVSTASHLQLFSVNAQETSPQGVFFKPDGLKMYITGSTGDDVNEYDLSTAWDVTTAVFLQLFSIAGQDTFPGDFFFKPDGLKMYIVGTTGDDVNEYDLSTAWDISTAVFLQLFSVSAQDTAPVGLSFKPDGLKMYIAGSANDSVYEYDLSTAWNVSTAVYLQLISVTTEETILQGLFFKPDGTKMYATGSSGDDVNEYDLSTAWNVSTATFLQAFYVGAQETAPRGVFFKPDGLKMYIVGSSVVVVNEYDLGTASTMTLPAAVENPPTEALARDTQVTYEFVTDDAGVTVTLIGEEVI